jgi:membrane associated rhomboid family serine protease
MTEAATDSPRRREPFFRAPLIVVLMTVLLLGLYTAYFFASFNERQELLWHYALAPERFWAPPGSPRVYDSYAAGLLTLLSTSLLHGDWFHVIVNSLMLLSFGTPVARALGTDIAGAATWMLLFVASILAGSALYLGLADVNTPYAVGASGGTCGLIAAAFLIDFDGRRRKLWSREFLTTTVVFAVINAVLTFVAPYLFGMGIAWEAHVGGYVAGALLMAVLPLRGYGGAKA